MITFSNIGYMGRFGNQMFQLASTVGIARRLGYDPVFPAERFITTDPNSYDGCKLLDCFNIPKELIKPINEISIQYLYNETDFTFNQETLRLPDSTSISGYFQTEKYFNFIKNEILEIFDFKDSIIEEARKIFEIRNGVSIHVRRGDYLGSPNHHPTQTLDYYNKALSEFNSRYNFYLFSDDIEWCKNNIKGKDFFYIESGSPYVDMYLMSQCKGHIIANSSFSWWGAWLSGSNKVIAPSQWFGVSLGDKKTEDIYCKGWKII